MPECLSAEVPEGGAAFPTPLFHLLPMLLPRENAHLGGKYRPATESRAVQLRSGVDNHARGRVLPSQMHASAQPHAPSRCAHSAPLHITAPGNMKRRAVTYHGARKYETARRYVSRRQEM